jgi:hypothetical protein
MSKIQINELTPIHWACEPKHEKFSWIEVKNGYATATNGSLIVRLNLREQNREFYESIGDCFIHCEVWKTISKFTKKGTLVSIYGENADIDELKHCVIDETKQIQTYCELTHPGVFHREIGDFPNWQKLWNEVAHKKMTQPIDSFGISPDQLVIMKKAMGNPNSFQMYVSDAASAIKIVIEDETISGFIMPVLIQQKIEFPTV